MSLLPYSTALLFSAHGDPTIYAAVGVGIGVYLFYRGFRMLQLKRLILNTPTSKVRSASIGLVEVNGLAVGPYTLTAPMTGYPCYYYHTIVWQRRQGGKSKDWHKVDDSRLNVPFYLDDNTGRLLVDPRGAQMELHCDFKQQYGSNIMFDDFVPSNVHHYLASRGISADSPLRIEEYCIKPKNALYILGTLAENPGLEISEIPVHTDVVPPLDPERSANVAGMGGRRPVVPPDEKELQARAKFAAAMGFRGAGQIHHPPPAAVKSQKVVSEPDETEIRRRELFAASFLGIAPEKAETGQPNPGSSGSPSAASDPKLPVDGAEKRRRELFMASVFGAPAQTSAAAGSTTAANGSNTPAAVPAPEEFDLHPPVVLMKGTNNPAFFVSWRSQHDVISELGWKSTLYIWGGPILTVAGVALLLIRFDVF